VSATYVRLRVGDEHYALPVETVLEVARPASLTPVPGAPAHLLGVMNLRGEVLPVVDLAALSGLRGPGEPTVIVVVEAGGARAGLAVDAVLGVGDLPAPSPTDTAREYVSSAALADGELVGILDADAALSAAARSVTR
jgi:purine-binding chemotaxis protein CheW